MTKLTRRAMLRAVGASTLTLPLPTRWMAKPSRDKNVVRMGMIADLHGGLAIDARQRLDDFLAAMKTTKCDALVQMGDFAYPNKKHQEFADKFNAAHDQTIHVIGNHEFDYGLKRSDCFKAWGIESAYYRRDLKGLRLLVLDGNETGSPTHQGGYPSYVGPKQQEWLKSELEAADRPVIILSHQPLAGRIAINNATEIQRLLGEFRDKILICFNGHSHVDSLQQVSGVSYLHVNSASYYWVGGKTRMLYYKDALFTVMTVDFSKGTLTVEARSSKWQNDSPEAIGYFDRPNAPPKKIVTPEIRGRSLQIERKQTDNG